MSSLRKLLPVALAGAAAASTAAASAPVSAPAPQAPDPDVTATQPVRALPHHGMLARVLRRTRRTFTVDNGDTLSGIAEAQCGNAADWTGIYAASRDVVGADPNLILAGEVVQLACHEVAAIGAAGAGPVSQAADSTDHAAPVVHATHHGRHRHHHRHGSIRTTGWGGYANPFRDIGNLSIGRIDEGVDLVGDGPVYALGTGVVTYSSSSSGWPGGGYVAYRLDAGPLAGKYIYVAENFTPAVSVGDHVDVTTVLGTMHSSYPYIETGFSQAPGDVPQAAAYGHYVEGQPTPEGDSFAQVLRNVEHARLTAAPGRHRHRHHHRSAGTGAGPGASLTGLSGTLGCAGLGQLWLAAGGSPALEHTMEGIAMAESSGRQFATGSAGEEGYWQINPVNGSATYDPLGNARAAVAIQGSQGLGAWTTYSGGLYAGRC